jgi:hypothetical protein
LFDEPKRVPRRPSGWILTALIVLATADALCAYAAGHLSIRYQPAIASLNQLQLSADDSRVLAEQIAAAEGIGWQRRRPNAAY